VDTIELARFLIGKTLVHDLTRVRSGRIVETEAYVVGDAAAHAFIGETRRNRSLFLERGRAYVYFIYGMHYLLNVASETRGVGAGVLFRALEPLEGIGAMERARGTRRCADLARGPGCLATAMGVGPRHDGVDLCGGEQLWLGTAVQPVGEIGESVRIGLTKEASRVLRFYERGNSCVSGPKNLRL
jgi:DNA-3-methyladenine glycosylase